VENWAWCSYHEKKKKNNEKRILKMNRRREFIKSAAVLLPGAALVECDSTTKPVTVPSFGSS